MPSVSNTAKYPAVFLMELEVADSVDPVDDTVDVTVDVDDAVDTVDVTVDAVVVDVSVSIEEYVNL